MRPIKFRAWHKCTSWGEMYKWGEFSISEQEIYLHDWQTNWEHDYFELMQYTWLIDSYWKEIYEWDIVRILYTDWRSPEFAIETLKNLPLDEYKKRISRIWVVTFYADKYAEWWLDMKWYSENIYEWTHWEKEVIGNIYENPEIFNRI